MKYYKCVDGVPVEITKEEWIKEDGRRRTVGMRQTVTTTREKDGTYEERVSVHVATAMQDLVEDGMEPYFLTKTFAADGTLRSSKLHVTWEEAENGHRAALRDYEASVTGGLITPIAVYEKPIALLFIARGEAEFGNYEQAKSAARKALDEAGLADVKFALFQGVDVVAVSEEKLHSVIAGGAT